MLRRHANTGALRTTVRKGAFVLAGALVIPVAPEVAHAENAVCVAASCEGTYGAVTTTGDARSSQGVAVSGTGDASGNLADVEAYGARAIVYDPVTGATVGVDNTGDARAPTTPEQILDNAYVPPPEPVAAKEAWVAKAYPEVLYQLAAGVAGLDPTLADGACPDGTCFPRSRTVATTFPRQQRDYWCGPAATQAVLNQIGGSASQAELAGLLNTTRDGTWWLSIQRTLNNRQSGVVFASYQLNKDSEPGHYMARLTAAVNGAAEGVPHAVVNNVKTSAFTFWGGPEALPAYHFNVSFGYSYANGGRVYVAEVYDSAYVGVRRRTNPYYGPNGTANGSHLVPLEQMFTAIRANLGIFIW